MRRSASSGSSSRPVKRTPRWTEGDSQALGPNPRQRSCLEPKSQPPRRQYIYQSCLDHLLSLLSVVYESTYLMSIPKRSEEAFFTRKKRTVNFFTDGLARQGGGGPDFLSR